MRFLFLAVFLFVAILATILFVFNTTLSLLLVIPYITFTILKTHAMSLLTKNNAIHYYPSTFLASYLTTCFLENKLILNRILLKLNIWTLHLKYNRTVKGKSFKISKSILKSIFNFNNINYNSIAFIGLTPIKASNYIERLGKVKIRTVKQSPDGAFTYFFIIF